MTSPILPLGLGTAEFGDLAEPTTDSASRATVEAAWEAGVRMFDTAPHYGLGLSERRLGAALRALPRDECMVSTKVGRSLIDVGVEAPDDAGFAVTSTLRRRFDFSRAAIRAGLADSLDRLGLDRIDIAYLHDPDDHWPQASAEGLPALRELQREGLIGRVGVGVNDVGTALRFVRECDIDVVMIAGRLTLLDRSAATELLPEALVRGVQVVAAAVFNSGILAVPDPGRAGTFDYRRAPAEIVDRVRRLAAVCRRHGVDLPAAALHFPLRHRGVVAVVAGTARADEVRRNADHLRAELPSQMWADLDDEGLLDPRPAVPAG